MKVIYRAASELEKDYGVRITFEEGAAHQIAMRSGGDVRKAINALEIIASATKPEGDRISINTEDVGIVAQRSAMNFDRDGDSHYDLLSAFQKSIRGSDPDAAIHYLARLLEGGDLASACRRLLVCAAEDVGLAYPQAMPIVVACVNAALQVGLPEARIPLAEAVIPLRYFAKIKLCFRGDRMCNFADIRSGNIEMFRRICMIQAIRGQRSWDGASGINIPIVILTTYTQQYLPDELVNRSTTYTVYNKTGAS